MNLATLSIGDIAGLKTVVSVYVCVMCGTCEKMRCRFKEYGESHCESDVCSKTERLHVFGFDAVVWLECSVGSVG